MYMKSRKSTFGVYAPWVDANAACIANANKDLRILIYTVNVEFPSKIKENAITNVIKYLNLYTFSLQR